MFEVTHQKGELVATETGDGIGLATGGLQLFTDLFQYLITDLVAQRIVDLLEMIQIDEQNRQFFPMALTVSNGLIQQAGKQMTIRQTGQIVMVREIIEFSSAFCAR